jgi:hypothetical protein
MVQAKNKNVSRVPAVISIMNLSCNESEVYTTEKVEEADIRVCAQSADLVSNYHIGKPYSLRVFKSFLHHDTRLELFTIL